MADSPDKIRGQASGQQLIYNQMLRIMGEPKQHIELVSAYFVPTRRGTDYLASLAQNRIKVRVLTNSFAANDVAVVHAFYKKYRHDLLKNGVQLYEFKPYIERKKRTWYEVMTGNVIPAKGKSASSLHAKFFDIDGMVFIGSFNFDPRSAMLNCEMGFLIDSPEMASRVGHTFRGPLDQVSYRPELTADDRMIWRETEASGEVVTWQQEPGATLFQQVALAVIGILPIEWML